MKQPEIKSRMSKRGKRIRKNLKMLFFLFLLVLVGISAYYYDELKPYINQGKKYYQSLNLKPKKSKAELQKPVKDLLENYEASKKISVELFMMSVPLLNGEKEQFKFKDYEDNIQKLKAIKSKIARMNHIDPDLKDSTIEQIAIVLDFVNKITASYEELYVYKNLPDEYTETYKLYYTASQLNDELVLKYLTKVDLNYQILENGSIGPAKESIEQ